MNRLIQLKRVTPVFFVALVLGCFALAPAARAACQDACLGHDNTVQGNNALMSLTTGTGNTAIGGYALNQNNKGSHNTAIGEMALYVNTTASFNTATGDSALGSNTSGSGNTATGYAALDFNDSGHGNTAVGAYALLTNNYHGAGNNNVALGYNAGSNLANGSGNVYIGAGVSGFASESDTTRIKNVYTSVASARIVYVNSDNKIGTLMSSRRFKEEIKPMDKASEAILALKPVTFRYKKEIEPNGAIMFGLIAEEVEKVAPNLVTRNDKGEVETVRYDAVNAMLLNEFLKEHRKVEQLEARLAQQEKDFTARLKEQDAKIQQVSDNIELGKPAPQVANNR